MSYHHIITISTAAQVVVSVLETNLGSALYLGFLNLMSTPAVGRNRAISLSWKLPTTTF